MSGPTTEHCPCCGGAIRSSRFDLSLGGPDPRDERLFFGIPGMLCLSCGSVQIDRDTRVLCDITADLPLALIESDLVLGRDITWPAE